MPRQLELTFLFTRPPYWVMRDCLFMSESVLGDLTNWSGRKWWWKKESGCPDENIYPVRGNQDYEVRMFENLPLD